MKYACLLILLVVTLTSPVWGAEVDQFTLRHQPLRDSTLVLNQIAQQHLAQAVARANRSRRVCEIDELYDQLKKYFSSHFYNSIFIEELFHNGNIDRNIVSKKQSIYSDWKLFDGLVLSQSKDGNRLALSPIIKVNGVRIGIDKFEHFFSRGFSYFKKHYLERKRLSGVLRSASRVERFIWVEIF